jgi:hypothetical protein
VIRGLQSRKTHPAFISLIFEKNVAALGGPESVRTLVLGKVLQSADYLIKARAPERMPAIVSSYIGKIL